MNIINFSSYKDSCMRCFPYTWGIVHQVINQSYVVQLVREFPTENFTPVFSDRSDKKYKMLARDILSTENNKVINTDDFTPLWKEFIAELKGQVYQETILRLAKINIKNFVIEIKLWRYINSCWLSAHTDKPDKIITQLFYFNTNWHDDWGGQLQILSSKNESEVYQEVTPDIDSSVILVRSDVSWHAVKPQVSPESTSRNVMQVSLWRNSNKDNNLSEY